MLPAVTTCKSSDLFTGQSRGASDASLSCGWCSIPLRRCSCSSQQQRPLSCRRCCGTTRSGRPCQRVHRCTWQTRQQKAAAAAAAPSSALCGQQQVRRVAPGILSGSTLRKPCSPGKVASWTACIPRCGGHPSLAMQTPCSRSMCPHCLRCSVGAVAAVHGVHAAGALQRGQRQPAGGHRGDAAADAGVPCARRRPAAAQPLPDSPPDPAGTAALQQQAAPARRRTAHQWQRPGSQAHTDVHATGHMHSSCRTAGA